MSRAITYDRGDLVLNEENAQARKEARRGRSRRIIAWIAFGVVVLSVPLSFAAIVSSVDDDGTSAEVVTNSPGRAVATQSLGRWLDEDPSPMPGASVLSWDSVQITQAPAGNGEEEGSYSIETHEFTLIDDYRLSTAIVTVRVDPVAGAVMIGTPTVMPRLPDTASDSGPMWFGYESFSAGASFEAGIQQWAEAFTSGDPQALRSAVNDPDTTRSYIPLTGVDSVQTRILGIAAPEDVEDEDVEYVLARIEVHIDWANAASEDGEEEQEEEFQNRALPVLTYDVLVSQPTSGSPRVVSWGGVGTGPQLSPYSVAVEGVSSLTLPTPTDLGVPPAEEDADSPEEQVEAPEPSSDTDSED